MRRALAVLAAVAMVAVAVVVRSALDDGDGDGSPDAGGVVLCAEDLLEWCESLPGAVEVRTEAAATTAQAISDGTVAADVDAWITTSAWTEVVTGRDPDAVAESKALARSGVVVAAAPGRGDALADLCGRRDVWECLGAAVGRSWGDDLGAGDPAWRELEAGIPDPNSATGLSVLASAATGWFAGTDFAANDLDPAFTDFVARLADASEGDRDPARTMAVRPGQYSAAGTLTQVAEGLRARGVDSVAPSTEVRAVVVAVALPGHRLPALGALEDGLRDDGWLGADEDDLAPTLKPGVMAALHSLWKDVSP